jgi:hypothetical protein
MPVLWFWLVQVCLQPATHICRPKEVDPKPSLVIVFQDEDPGPDRTNDPKQI